MAAYRVFIKASAAKEIERLPTRKLRRAIVDRIHALAQDPRPSGCVKLSGADKYRVRHGAYRILYRIAIGTCQVAGVVAITWREHCK